MTAFGLSAHDLGDRARDAGGKTRRVERPVPSLSRRAGA